MVKAKCEELYAMVDVEGGAKYAGRSKAPENKAGWIKELRRLMAMLGEGLEQGGIGVGAGIVYTPGADHKETYELIRTVGQHGVCLFVHIRQQHTVGMEDLHEILAVR